MTDKTPPTTVNQASISKNSPLNRFGDVFKVVCDGFQTGRISQEEFAGIMKALSQCADNQETCNQHDLLNALIDATESLDIGAIVKLVHQYSPGRTF